MNNKRIALLATGDEIVNGDILNTNGQAMAAQLFGQGIEIGMHLIVSDQQAEIENAIHYLLATHDALIITGGLGPTSDDRTRFALAQAVKRKLVFDQPTWEKIQILFSKYTLVSQPKSNENQAMFPEDASVIPNDVGSAAGCWLNFHGKLIFMLPGPPSECLPMFQDTVMPKLLDSQFSHPFIHRKWLLFNVSEGEIADKLDRLAEPFDLVTGYRVNYPYVEFKIHSENQEAISGFLDAADELIQANLINRTSIPASQVLIQRLEKARCTIHLKDEATKGHLAKTLTTLNTHEKIVNTPDETTQVFEITGMPEYWKGKERGGNSWLKLRYKETEMKFEIPYRGERTILYAVEFLSREITKLLT